MAIVTRARRSVKSGAVRRPVPGVSGQIKTVTLRDFSGLMVTSENDLNLQTRFAKRLINMELGPDGALSIRPGTKLDIDYATATQPSETNVELGFEMTEFSTLIKITGSTYTPVIGQRITLSGITLLNIDAVNVNGSRVVVDFDDDGFYVVMDKPASSTATETDTTVSWSLNNWYDTDAEILYGDVIHNREVVVTNKGDVIARDANNNVINLFSNEIAQFGNLTLEASDQLTINHTTAPNVFSFTLSTTTATRPAVGDIIKIEGVTTDFAGFDAEFFNNYHVVQSVTPAGGPEPVDTVITCNLPSAAAATADSVETATITRSIATGWSDCTFVSGAQFNNTLLLFNGINKPLEVSFLVTDKSYCSYIIDPASGSNANTPAGKYVAAGQDYVVVAGVATAPRTVYISNTNTYTVWPGDGAPNDAVTIDVTSVVGSAKDVTGVSFHRDLLAIMLENDIVFYRLGNFVSNLHVPTKVDAVVGYGSISHKSTLSIGDRLISCDFSGIIDLKETLLKDRFGSNRMSEAITPTIVDKIIDLTLTQANEEIWSLHNKTADTYMLFMPVYDGVGGRETWVFNYVRKENRKRQGWSIFRGWNFTAGWLSTTERVKFAQDLKVYTLGTVGDMYYGDFITDANPTGDNVDFVWEMPWIDFGRRMHTKSTRYIKIDSRGTASFTAQMFVDNIYLERVADPTTIDPEDDFNLPLLPYLSMLMRGGDDVGYGAGTQTYGGGRRTSDERLYAWNAKCSIAKLRFYGSSYEELKLVSVTLGYQDGDIRR